MLPDAGSQQRLFAGSVEFVPVAVERATAFSSMAEAQDAFGHLPYPVQILVDEFVQREAMSAYRAPVDGGFVSAASSGESPQVAALPATTGSLGSLCTSE